MSLAELRFLSALAIAALLMVPCGLLLCGRRRVAQMPGTPYQMGGADLFLGLVLYGLMTAILFAGKWWLLSHPKASSVDAGPLIATDIFLNLIFVQGMQLGIIWAWFRVRQAKPAEVFGLTKLPFLQVLRVAALSLLPAGIIATLALMLTILGLKALGWPMEPQEAVSMLTEAKDFPVQLALIVGACLGAPIMEEVLFRGVLYGSLRSLTNKWFAAIVSALLFGVIHLHLPSLPALCLLGFFFALAYEYTGSLTVNIVMHGMFNSLQVILAFWHGAP